HAHGDGKPALGVAEKGGTVVFKCRVGCSQEQVVAALKERGLWTQPPQQRVPRAKTDRSRGPKPSSPIDYLIKRPDGELVAIHRRFDSPGGPKFFAWFQPGGGVSGLNGLPAAELPLYRGETLADLIIQAPVTVVEGEKAADHLAACLDGAQVGVLATVGGAATVPTDGVLAALADRRVVLWPDNDEPGQRHMDQVAAGLQRVGAAEVKFASWPDAPERGDAADYVAEHSRGELLELLKAARPVPAGKSLPGGDYEKDQLDQLVPVAGDFLNAERFLTVYGDDIRWVPELRAYFIWNGSRWEEDRTDRAPAAAQETISKLRPWAAEEGIAESEAKRRFSHYLASAKGGRAEALLAVARTRIAIGIKDLDQHPYLLAAKGATIDLRSGEVKDPDRADLITRGSDHEYHPDAKGDNWVKVLETTFGGDQELIQSRWTRKRSPPRLARRPAGLALTHSVDLDQVQYCCPAPSRAQKFPRDISLSISICNSRSATIRFSRRFSSRSWRSSLASLALYRPWFPGQRNRGNDTKRAVAILGHASHHAARSSVRATRAAAG
ncbi:MAG: hypothetical protein ACREN7_10120, partial [Candidatus Dormibacteria bacterium]